MANYTNIVQFTQTSSDGSSSLTGKATDTGNTLSSQANTFAAASAGASLTMSFVKANLQQFFLVADQNCTVKTNSNSTPQDTLTLIANIPYYWSLSSGLTNPFGGNVTSAFVTCTPATTIKYRILQT